MTRVVLLLMPVLLSTLGFSFLLQSEDPQQSLREWRVYSGDLAGTKYSELDQINRSNVRSLQPAWIFHTDDLREGHRSTIECNPIIVNGLMYLTSPALKVIALDAATGRQVWQFNPFKGDESHDVNRGVTYWEDGEDRRIFFVATSYLYALDSRDGKPVADFGSGGRIDLRHGLDRDVSSLKVTATTPGVIYRDLLILGSAVSEGPSPSAPGHIRAFDVRSGERRWIFHTIPHPGEPGYETWPPEAWSLLAPPWMSVSGLLTRRQGRFCGNSSWNRAATPRPLPMK